MSQRVMSQRVRCCALLKLLLLLSLALVSPAKAQSELNIYSSRASGFIGPLLKLFEAFTGIKTNVTYEKKKLLEKVAADSAQGSVDIILANGFSELIAAKRKGLTQPVTSAKLEERIPARYRDPEGHWFGLSKRARIILASKARIKKSDFTYEELADPKWQGRICIRSGKHPYNIGLIASLIAHKGEVWTESWLIGLKANLSAPPTGNDRAQARKIYEGKCDIALINSYYVGAMQTNEKKPEQKAWAAASNVIFPNQRGRGAHISITGMALARNARNVENAKLLMDFLTSRPAQFFYALENYEYPVREDVAVSQLVAGWGRPRFDIIELDRLAALTENAIRLVEQVGFDAGPTE